MHQSPFCPLHRLTLNQLHPSAAMVSSIDKSGIAVLDVDSSGLLVFFVVSLKLLVTDVFGKCA